MKVETPQILWNNEADKGINAPLLSIDILASGVTKIKGSHAARGKNANEDESTHVLVTAGNAACINLWRVNFGLQGQQQHTGVEKNGNQPCCSDSSIFQNKTKPLFNKIDYMTSLTRHDVTVNSVAFSPDGLHLATAGDSGNIVIWSVPVNKRGNNNGRHFWSTLDSEKDLTVRIVSTHCEGIVDLSWSSDSKRFTVGTIDSCVLIYEDKHHSTNACSPETHRKESDWQLVFRNADQHGSFVQGVAYDPLDVYIASMGGDRTVRIFPRKAPVKSKKKVLRPANSNHTLGTHSTSAVVTPPPPEHQRIVSNILTEAKLELGKPKRIKQRSIMIDDCSGDDEQENVTNAKSNGEESQLAQQRHMKQVKHKLFVDESNCESFFRRLSWTVDGAFLVTPAALWHGMNNIDGEKKASSVTSGSPLFSTYLFARHRFDEPYRVLTGLDKPSVVVRPNPVLFQLPPSTLADLKENQCPLNRKIAVDRNGQMQTPFPATTPSSLPYRSVFAVLTLDSILIYDTHHTAPLSVLQGLHYSGLTDCCWSSDGLNLMVCSSDGYISIVNFAEGELGKAYSSPALKTGVVSSAAGYQLSGGIQAEVIVEEPLPAEVPPLPLCEDDVSDAVLIAPAAKKAKKTRITPTLVSTGHYSSSKSETNGLVSTSTTAMAKPSTSKRGISETDIVGDVVTKLSLDANTSQIENNVIKNDISMEEIPKKKKKRVQPLLVSTK